MEAAMRLEAASTKNPRSDAPAWKRTSSMLRFPTPPLTTADEENGMDAERLRDGEAANHVYSQCVMTLS